MPFVGHVDLTNSQSCVAGGLVEGFAHNLFGTGGVYLWDSRTSAEAWFTEDRVEELTQRFGARPRLTWYDTHVTVDNLKDETRVNGASIEVMA